MTDPPPGYLARIRKLRPRLRIHTAELNTEGLINDVVIVNRELVFRFAKDERAIAALAAEARVLGLLDGRLTVSIPRPALVEEDLLVYPFIDGAPLTRAALLSAGGADRTRLAGELARFLRELHETPLNGDFPDTPAPVSREAWQMIADQARERVYPLLLPYQVAWAERLFREALSEEGFFEYEPALIHGDLAPYHILYDEGESRLRGILDFGVAGRGDPAIDLASLLTFYGESFVELVAKEHQGTERTLRRARFHAQAIELQWALNGFETGQHLWFLAHLGGARDIKP